ncbi:MULTISPECIES: PAS domain S-box protein [Deefgea]|uniref:histidine kinase n=1 Tax=Deefgea chitinilytica TaxID=570276 RepID=A0ABS2CEF6_9NEIS|nr:MULTISPECIES: PAS domain S-box protein [Deefgea]MBM5572533.1 PAS domain S-box protein [Deefgea chitinilytica]MBM9889769.1 PAS domain S-box protein [Deefgea sp. CFH1-16]
MNKLLARQLKRHLAWADDSTVETLLQSIERAADVVEDPAAVGVLRNFRRLLTAVDDAYSQFDRDVALGSRSLQISSDELTQANETLRQEAARRQRAIDALWQTAGQLQLSLGLPPMDQKTADLEQLSALMGQLVDAREKAEAALLAQEAQFRTLASNIPGVVFRCQIDYPWGMYYINEEIEVLTGYTSNVFLAPNPSRSYGSLIHVEDLASVESAVNVAMMHGERYSVEYRIVDAKGQLRWVYERGQVVRDASGHAEYLDGMIFDVTEQKNAANQLRQLSAAIEASPSPVLITDVKGKIEYANPKFEQTFGYLLSEIRGKNPTEVLSGSTTKPIIHEQIMQSLMEGAEWRQDLRNRCKDGSLVWMSVSISPIRDGAGQITHFVAVYENIELRKAAEQELIRAKEAADQANRLKSDFLANMSHEIRTPMNAIIGMTHLTLQTELTHKQRDYLSKTSLAAESLLHILNDILDFSKIEADRLQLEHIPFSFEALFTQLRSLHQIKAEEKGLQLSFNLAADCPVAFVGDPLRLGQILNNLVSNAIKFTQQGGIRVDVEMVAQLAGRVRLHIAVTDTGIGLSPEQIKLLFKPFSQADGSTTRQFGGTGLGLSICKRLIAMMEGDVWVESVAKQGSTFHFTLWLERSEEAPLTEVRMSRGPNLHGVRILLVEDNPLNQQVANELLVGAGASVILAQHGGEALAWLSIKPMPCDIILMDLQMPVLDGHQAARLIRTDARFNDLPIIAMTAHAMSDERQRCLDAGMNDYITKPIQPDVLFTTVAKWAGQHIIDMTQVQVDDGYIDESIVPQIEGVNTQSVLQRLMGDAHLYEALFKQFLTDYRDANATLAQLLQSDYSGAERFAHSMKGVAGTLGMTELAAKAGRLEQVLHANPGQAGESLQPFNDALDAMLLAVNRVYGAAAPQHVMTALDDEHIDALMMQLLDLLDACDGDAVDLYYQLCDGLDSDIDRHLFDRLGNAITNEFNFTAAKQYLLEIQHARGKK